MKFLRLHSNYCFIQLIIIVYLCYYFPMLRSFTISSTLKYQIYKTNKLQKLYVTTISDDESSVANTGAFKFALPARILKPEIHFEKALKNTLHTIRIDNTIKNARQAQRKHTAQSFDQLMKYLNNPITEILEKYHPTFILRQKLHPYESTVANLTIIAREKKGLPEFKQVLLRLKELRATTSRIAKEFAAKAGESESSVAAKELLQEGIECLRNIYSSKQSEALSDILDIQKDLRRIPVVELETPTVVLVGSPNVGKSSIVRSISSGTPEVNDYPFTTRGVTIGHIINPFKDLRIQVMDTPGLLDRPAVDRNEMEKLTFASLAHLPTAVIFVIDPTGLSGEKSTLEAQLNVRS